MGLEMEIFIFPFPFPGPFYPRKLASLSENAKILDFGQFLRKIRLSRDSRKKIFLSVPKHFDLAGQNA